MSDDTNPTPETPNTPPAASKKPAPPLKTPAKATRVVENCRLPISSIKIPEQWNREGPGKLDTLTESLKTHGQIVAITVRPGEKPGEYELVDGRRRILAMQEAGIKDAVATIVESADSTDAYAKSFVANMHRLQHNPMEISDVFATLNETLKNKEIARLCGVAESTVSQHLSIRKLPVKFLNALKKGQLLMTEARELCRLDVEEDSEFLDKVGSAMVEGTLDSFLGAEKISIYLDRKDAKNAGKEGKGKSKGKGKGEGKSNGKSQGRQVKVKDYTTAEVKEQVKMYTKPEGLERLIALSEKLAATKSEANLRYLKGRLDEAETLCGLREPD